MHLKPESKLNGVISILAIAVLMAGGCSGQDDSAANGRNVSEKQPPATSQADGSTPPPDKPDASREGEPQHTADTVYTNGKIYTVNEEQPWAEAVAIKDSKFIAVGTNADVEAHKATTTKVVDLDGKFAMPGIHDMHVHPTHVNCVKEQGQLLFPESATKEEIIEALKKYATANPDLKIIKGSKWDTALFPDGKATKDWLDAAIPDRPVLLADKTFHNAVANSAALELAGITKDTPNPEFGVIDRDPKTGEPTGYLSEQAISLVQRFVPRPSAEHHYRGLKPVLETLHAYGTTSFIELFAGPEGLNALRRLDREGKLNMRVNVTIGINDLFAEFTTLEESEKIIARRKELSSDLIGISAKFFADGTPLSYTSLLLEPYADKPGTSGQLTMGDAQLKQIVQLHKQGVVTRYHTCGDGTTRKILDVLEEAQKESPNEVRHHLGHLMCVDREDIPRFKQLNLIADFSPTLFYPSPLTMLGEAKLGKERFARWQPIKEFVDAGVLVVWGSDWPAGTPDADPWRSLEAMITRRDPHGAPDGPKLGEGIDLATGIVILTINGAKAMTHEDRTGSIEVGKFADMIILDRNLFEIDPHDLSNVKVLSTLFAGNVVFDRKKKISQLDVIDIEITNKDLDNAVDAAELNLLVQNDLGGGATCRCFPGLSIGPGHGSAPEAVNRAFTALMAKGYRFVQHARQISWKDDGRFWIQWATRDYETVVLFAYDPEPGAAVEVLRVRDK